ncbi:unnamed protein product [Boreogadus saida]
MTSSDSVPGPCGNTRTNPDAAQRRCAGSGTNPNPPSPLWLHVPLILNCTLPDNVLVPKTSMFGQMPADDDGCSGGGGPEGECVCVVLGGFTENKDQQCHPGSPATFGPCE